VDWAGVVRKLHRIPTVKEYALHGRYATSTVLQRFRNWGNVPDAFRAYARRKPRWKRVLKYLKQPALPVRMRHYAYLAKAPPQPRFKRPMPQKSHPQRRQQERIAKRPLCGERLGMGGPLCFAPTNEQGVVMLFGKLAEHLGFFVLGVQCAFPDCAALHKIAPGNWQPVTIEFEFESRNFRMHRHDPTGCDFIVCWEHNWTECPENLRVIALKEYVKALG
jgi:hypothetical protein